MKETYLDRYSRDLTPKLDTSWWESLAAFEQLARDLQEVPETEAINAIDTLCSFLDNEPRYFNGRPIRVLPAEAMRWRFWYYYFALGVSRQPVQDFVDKVEALRAHCTSGTGINVTEDTIWLPISMMTSAYPGLNRMELFVGTIPVTNTQAPFYVHLMHRRHEYPLGVLMLYDLSPEQNVAMSPKTTMLLALSYLLAESSYLRIWQSSRLQAEVRAGWFGANQFERDAFLQRSDIDNLITLIAAGCVAWSKIHTTTPLDCEELGICETTAKRAYDELMSLELNYQMRLNRGASC